MRAVIYARYSTDLQHEASIEDQVRVCRQRASTGRAGRCWQPIATARARVPASDANN